MGVVSMPRGTNGLGDTAQPVSHICRYRWTDDVNCTGGENHVCWRTTPDHRTHLCTCEAIELRTTVPTSSLN
jgi:hypothetical protein